MPDKPLTIATYAAGASLAAVTLVYIFGPTFFLDEDTSRNSRKGGVVGLSNPANDCFINSVLQALAGLGDLRVYLIKEIHRRRRDEADSLVRVGSETESDPKKARTEEGLRKGLVTQALKEMLDKLNERPISKKTISASEFVTSLENAFGIRLSRRQQDAQEMLQVVAERLCDEYHAGVKARRKSQRLGIEQQSPSEKTQPDSDNGTSTPAVINEKQEKPVDEISTVTSTASEPTKDNSDDNAFPFEGCLESQVECSFCHFKPKPSVSTFVTLTLNVPQESSTTLDKCLDGLLKLELIDDYQCDRCRLDQAVHVRSVELDRTTDASARARLEKEVATLQAAIAADPEIPPPDIALPPSAQAPKRRISKHTRISVFPKILAVHLSRSIFGPSSFSLKNTAKTKFPEFLTLGGFDRRRYKLLALVTHQGSHSSGHYETFRRQVVTPGFAAPNAFDPTRSRLSMADSRPSSSAATTSTTATAADPPVAASTSSRSPHSRHQSDGARAEAQSKLRKRRHGANERWWRISDDKIKECGTADVLGMQKDAYLLFYELDGSGMALT